MKKLYCYGDLDADRGDVYYDGVGFVRHIGEQWLLAGGIVFDNELDLLRYITKDYRRELDEFGTILVFDEKTQALSYRMEYGVKEYVGEPAPDSTSVSGIFCRNRKESYIEIGYLHKEKIKVYKDETSGLIVPHDYVIEFAYYNEIVDYNLALIANPRNQERMGMSEAAFHRYAESIGAYLTYR